MRPSWVTLWGYALLALVWATPAQAAWNNVFQVCCNGCKQPQIAAYPPVPAASSNCQQNCTTSYIQRSFYQPVTTYRTTYYMEPVTTMRTSYFYEPVTSYRYSCYFDPCACSYQQRATPCTSYRLRQQSCPVTSYLQRACLQPVTTYQQMNYYVPQTTCCNTTTGDPIMNLPPGAQMAPGNGGQSGGSMGPSNGGPMQSNDGWGAEPPRVGEQRINPMPGNNNPANPLPPVEERHNMPSGGGARYERNYNPPSFGTPYPAAPTAPTAPRPPAQLRLDRTASLDDVNLRGQLVGATQAPLRNTRVLFVSADQDRVQTSTTTTGEGRFDVNLSSGTWLVYTPGQDGRPVFNQKVYVEGSGPRSVLLVSYNSR